MAGYEYLKFGNFKWNPEHPPLAKEIAALPLMIMDINSDHDSRHYQNLNQFPYAARFLFEINKDKSFRILNASRSVMVVFGLIILAVIFVWAYDLAGFGPAIVSTGLFALSPSFLAHAPLITTDVSSTAFGFLSFYMIYKLVDTQRILYLFFAGLCMGLAMSCKHSVIILLPVAACSMGFGLFQNGIFFQNALRWAYPATSNGKLFHSLVWMIVLLLALTPWLFAGGLLLLMAILILSLQIVKYLQKRNDRLLCSTRSLIDLLLCLTFLSMIFCLTALAVTPLFYFDYSGSIMVNDPFKSFNNLTYVLHHALKGHRFPVFLNGKHSFEGFIEYYFILFSVKSSLPVLFCFFAGICTMIFSKKNRPHLLSLFVPIMIYLILISLFNKAQIGIRHALFIYPFIMVAAAILTHSLSQTPYRYAGFIFAFIMIFTQATTSFSSYPNYISFTNGLLFEPRSAYQHISDSNLDWGQNVKALVRYLQSQGEPEIRTSMYYQSLLAPYGYNKFTPVHESQINRDFKGFLVMDVQQYNLWPDTFTWLKKNRIPDTIINNTILIYHFP